MKMELFSCGTVVGLLLVLLGISIVLKAFGINFPVMRIVLALILIYFGIRLLIGWDWNCCRRGNSTVFGETNVVVNDTNISKEYSVVFGQGKFDLSTLTVTDKNRELEIATVFGQGTIILNPAVPAVVKIDSAFGSGRAPDGNIISFGSYTYKSKAYKENAPALEIDANVVFGELVVKNAE